MSQPATDKPWSGAEIDTGTGPTLPGHEAGREELAAWQDAIRANPVTGDPDFVHSLRMYFPDSHEAKAAECEAFGARVTGELEDLVAENSYRLNLPRLEAWDGIGRRVDRVVHHPAYDRAGDIIYGSGMMERLLGAGGLLDHFRLYYLSTHAGEAGHNCPVACSAGLIRVLQRVGDAPYREEYLRRLTAPSYAENLTGAQFLTEVQGGSDVGRNATVATRAADGSWRITGEKWFCSNANADLILMTARYDTARDGTRGLGLFLVPAYLDDGRHNDYRIRRLKEKLGTTSMASGEMDFLGALAWHMGPLEQGFRMVMENVLHLSRLYNTVGFCGLIKRAFDIAHAYARHRVAFGHVIAEYPLVQENLATVRADHGALLAGIFATTRMQDRYDTGEEADEDTRRLLRLLANVSKYVSARWGVDHIHHCLDVLAGNGAIETFSAIPRLLRDSIVFENWEGTHNTLRMQTLRDIHRLEVDRLYLAWLQRRLGALEDGPEKAALERGRRRLAEMLDSLRAADAARQTLIVRDVVDLMGVLLGGVTLLAEALHQRAENAGESKLTRLRLFLRNHLGNGDAVYDDAYLDLIRRVAAL
ncbi:MAG TPA: acyl-CoA dehydrogenase family protein [Gammaproteobacteria bacterium]|nr:acyl-CoA dehydrogenase family protein [Gammaproteobacteria bacterium]